MSDMRCSFCFRPRTDDTRGVAGARAYICADCVGEAVSMLLNQAPGEPSSLHPASDEFLNRLLAFRQQLETDHASREDHADWEKDLEELERAVRRVRERIISGAKV